MLGPCHYTNLTPVREARDKFSCNLVNQQNRPYPPTLTSPLVNQADEQERFILCQPRLWWDMYHDRPTFSLVKWSDDDVDEYRAGLETEEGVHAVSPVLAIPPPNPQRLAQ